MPEILCNDCGKRLFHENEDTLKLEESVHKKFCRKKEGDIHSYVHRDEAHDTPMDSERELDHKDQPVLKK